VVCFLLLVGTCSRSSDSPQLLEFGAAPAPRHGGQDVFCVEEELTVPSITAALQTIDSRFDLAPLATNGGDLRDILVAIVPLESCMVVVNVGYREHNGEKKLTDLTILLDSADWNDAPIRDEDVERYLRGLLTAMFRSGDQCWQRLLQAEDFHESLAHMSVQRVYARPYYLTLITERSEPSFGAHNNIRLSIVGEHFQKELDDRFDAKSLLDEAIRRARDTHQGGD
jgi:hypothetical protein